MKLVKATFLILTLKLIDTFCSSLNIKDLIRNGTNGSTERGDKNITQDFLEERDEMRRLQASTGILSLDQAYYLPLDHKPDAFSTFYYLDSKMNNETSNHILYPYVVNPSGATPSNSKGGVFDLSKIRPSTTVPAGLKKNHLLSRGRPLYAINIGIFSHKINNGGAIQDVFVDSNHYCNFFTKMSGHSVCIESKAEYDDYVASGSNKPVIIILTKDTIRDHLMIKEDGAPLIKLLVMSDYMSGKETEAYQFLDADVISKINIFLNNGGKMIVDGRSGFLLEHTGHVQRNTYYTRFIMRTKSYLKPNPFTTYCDNLQNQTPETDTDPETGYKIEFFEKVICMNPVKQASCINSFTIQTPYLQPFYVFATYSDYENLHFVDPGNGGPFSIADEYKKTPYLMGAPYGYEEGFIYIFNGQAIFNVNATNFVRNIYLDAMSRDALIRTNLALVGDNPVPSGEPITELTANIIISNYFQNSLNDVVVHVFFPNKTIEYVSVEHATCSIVDNTIDIKTYDAKKRGFNHLTNLKCLLNPILENSEYTIKLKVNFLYMTTMEYATELTVLQAIAFHSTNKKPNSKSFMMTEPLKTPLAKGAVIRASLDNSNPSFYPLPSTGVNQKITVKLQNQQQTDAKSMKYIEVIPLASPLIDGNDYSTMGHTMDFYSQYYVDNDFPVPFNTIDQEDHLDISYLNDKNVVLVPEYDERVKVQKEVTAQTISSLNQRILIQNVNYSSIIEDPLTILKQKATNYVNGKPKSSQRLMCFLDDKMKSKKEVIFARIDIAFETDIGYKPTNVKKNHVFSIDKTPQEADKGTFTQAKLSPEKSLNSFLSKSGAMIVNADDNAKLQSLSNDLTLTHYLIPVMSLDITSIDQLEGFTPNPDDTTTGYQTDYPLIKYIKGHTISMTIQAKNEQSKGGKIIIKLPSTATFTSSTPIEEHLISYSSDKVSFYKTTYEASTHTIESFFKSGVLKLQNSNIVINIEGLILKQAFTAEIELFEMKYDLSIEENNHEVYVSTLVDNAIQVNYMSFFSLPALEVRIARDVFKGKELKAPYTEYSLYFQELYHRTVYGSMKSNHVSSPGVQLKPSDFTFVSKIGTSTQNLNDYMSGKSTAIPSSATTSRVEWNDLWERHWAQPLSTIYTEAPCTGTGGTNKGMSVSTTYELTDKDGNRRLEYVTNEEVYLKVKVNLYNNFNKFFEPSICSDNRVPFQNAASTSPRFYTEEEINAKKYTGDAQNLQLMTGYSADYGKCYKEVGAKMNGVSVTSDKYTELDLVKLCNPTSDDYTTCVESMKTKMKLGKNKENYSSLVESFYPHKYITPEMWALNVTDYCVDEAKIGYKEHMDNRLPSIDSTLIKPETVIQFPLLKPLDISYDYINWTSQNLQNVDNTILAGQDLSADAWINYKDFDPSLNIQEKAKNEYMCLFNQHRIKVLRDQNKMIYPPNIFQNNVIPIIKNPSQNYDCSGVTQYTPQNIYTYNNKEETQSDVDWLNFGASLRASGRETIDIVMKLSLKSSYFEGITKLIDKIEFKYKNPLNEATDPKVIAPQIAIDAAYQKITMNVEMFPTSCYATNCNTFLIITIDDVGQDEREYKSSSYRNSYGFGDLVTSIQIGDINGGKCTLEPEESTYFSVQITNNAGYDFDLFKTGIEYVAAPPAEGEVPVDSLLLKDYVSHVQNPTSMPFITFTLPSTIAGVITPSDHLATLPFEDLETNNINPSSIKNGKTSTYYFKLTILPTFNANYRGHMQPIKATLNLDHFNQIIGKNNHPDFPDKYQIKIPDIKVGVPFAPPHASQGKVYIYSLKMTPASLEIISNYCFRAVQRNGLFFFLDKKYLEEFKNSFIGNPSAYTGATTWFYRYHTREHITITEMNDRVSNKNGFTAFKDTIPSDKVKKEPLHGKFYNMIHFKPNFAYLGYEEEEAPIGKYLMLNNIKFDYLDYNRNVRSLVSTKQLFIESKGPLLNFTFSHQLASEKLNGQIFEVIGNDIYATLQGRILTTIVVTNKGNDAAYFITITFRFLTLTEPFLIDETNRTFRIDYDYSGDIVNGTYPVVIGVWDYMGTGETTTFKLLYGFYKPMRNLEGTYLDDGTIVDGPTGYPLIQSIDIQVKAQGDDGEMVNLNNTINRVISVPYAEGGKARRKEIDVKINNEGTFENPLLKIKPETKFFKYDSENYKFILYRKINFEGEESTWDKVSEQETNETFTDAPITDAVKNYTIDYRIESVRSDTGLYVTSGINTHEATKNAIGSDIATDDEDNKNIAIILLIVFSVVIFLSIIIAIIFFVVRSRKNKKEQEKDDVPEIKHVGTEEVKVLPTDGNVQKMSINETELSPDKLSPGQRADLRNPTFIRIRNRNQTGSIVNLQKHGTEEALP